MVQLTVHSRSSKPSRNFPLKLAFDKKKAEDLTVLDVKKAVYGNVRKLYPDRQRLTTADKKPLIPHAATLASLGVRDGDDVYVKDLGPQVSWRVVFLVEYLGPLLIHPIFYHFGPTIYRREFEHSHMQTAAYALVMAHFVKRELETLFVHRFSSSTMPFRNIFRNSAHYWLLSGLLIALALYGPWYSAPHLAGSLRDDQFYLWCCVAVWLFAQFSNFDTHTTLRDLRPEGTTQRGIPRGYGFGLVSCPNYLFEILGWSAMLALSGSWAVAVFLVVSAVTMAKWADKKHRAYKREFGDKYPKHRRRLVPFIW